MSFLKELVNYYSKKHPEKWAKSVACAKRKYVDIDVMLELRNEERSSSRKYRAFVEKERCFLIKLYVSSIKNRNQAVASSVAEILKQDNSCWDRNDSRDLCALKNPDY